MIAKRPPLIRRQYFYFLGMPIALTCLCIGLIGAVILQNKGVSETDPASVSGNFFIWALGCGIAALILLCLIMFKSHHTIPEELTDTYKLFAEHHSAALSHAMTEISLGNLSTKAEMPTWDKAPPIVDFFSRAARDVYHQLQAVTEELNDLTFMPSRRLFYVGADSYLEGRQCGEVMGQLLNGRGKVVISTSSFTVTGQELRRKGFESVIRKKYPKIDIVKVIENHEDQHFVYKNISELIDELSGLDGIYVTEGTTPASTARAVEHAGKHGRIKIVAHDMTNETMHYIQKGIISGTVGQDPFAQGHDPLIHLFNHIISDWTPPVPRLLTHLDVVTPDNYTRFWQSGIGVFQSDEKLEMLAKPVAKVSEKPIKLAIVFRADNPFWFPVRDGYRAAEKKLAPFNVGVEWIEPEFDGVNMDIEAFAELLQSLKKQGVHGIATVAPDRPLIPLLNEMIDQGIVVGTLNSEPLNMRSLVHTITDQANQLMNVSQNLTLQADQASQATLLIKSTTNSITEGAASQNNQIHETKTILQSLLDNIARVSRVTDESARAAETTTKAVREGVDAMEKSLKVMQNIQQAVSYAGEIVSDLAKHSKRVDNIVEMIQDISSRVNVLALNASIEATQAKDEGEGFMVVAREIRRLALNAQDTSDEIEKIVTTVKADIGDVDGTMNEGLNSVQTSTESTTRAQMDLADIITQVDQDQTRMKTMADMMAEMQTFSHRVQEAMDRVAEISESNKTAVDNIHESTQEMTGEFHKVTNLSDQLEAIAQSELELLAKFNLS